MSTLLRLGHLTANGSNASASSGNSELSWSPDSRYLLGVKENDRCGSYSSTLQTINVETFSNLLMSWNLADLVGQDGILVRRKPSWPRVMRSAP